MNARIAFFSLGIAIAATAHGAYFPSPEDWRDENIYFIFLDRFNDGDPSNNNAESSSGANFNPTSSNGIHGGDLRGVEKKLDYIKSLGATAIWITPIVRNNSGSAYHGYGAQDFYQLAPHYGTLTDLSNMVAAAHARNIKVMLDVVCNHSGDLLYSTDSGWSAYKTPPAGYNLRYRNSSVVHAPPFLTNALAPTFGHIFHTNGVIGSFTDPEQIFGELSNLDDFNTELTYVRTNMVNIWKYWIQIGDVDGFRIDTVKHVEMGFWTNWCPAVRQHAVSLAKSNFFMFGEVWDSDPKCGSYTGTKNGGPNFALDSVLDYPLYYNINSAIATASGNTKQIEDHYNNIAANYDPSAWFRLVTFLDNHDNVRFLNSASNNTNRLAVALALLYSSRGIPCLYYGTEQAFNGGGDPNNREDMFAGQWPTSGPSVGDNFNLTHPLFQLVAKLNNFRRLYTSLRRGGHRNLLNNPGGPGLFAYARTNGTEEVFVVFNTGSTQTTSALPTTYPAGTVLVNLLNTNETVTVNSTPNIPAISVPSTSAKIFIAQTLILPLDPVVTAVSPAHGATNVSSIAPIVLSFSKPMDTNSVQAAFSTQPSRAGSFVWNALRNTMTFTPSAALTGTTNNVSVATNAFDSVDAKNFFAPFESYFVTSGTAPGDTNPPAVFITSPVSGATVTGTVSITGTATDNVAVAKVEVNVDGGAWSLASGTTNWSFSLNTQNQLNGTHTIAARATDTSSNVSGIASVSVRFFNVPGPYLTRISAGNPSNVTDCVANVWVQDQAYSAGSFGYSTGGTGGYVPGAISNVCASVYPLYARERYSTSGSGYSYLFDCPAGVYETTLLEAETWWSNVNQRVFNVFIEGQQVLTNFDILAAAGGRAIPLTRVFTNTVADAQLKIDFVPIVDNARASGIQVRKIADLDTDADGIPDWWMLAYFDHPTGQAGDNSLSNQDADGDGFTNLQEYLAGTDPTDPNSAFRITDITLSGNDLAITWTTRPSKTNQLQRGSSLDTGTTWSAVGALIIGSGSPATQVDPGAATNSSGYYRVRLVP